MHAQRVLVALVAIPLLYLMMTKLPALAFLLLLAVTGSIALYEFYAMCGLTRGMMLAGIACSLLVYLPFLVTGTGAVPMMSWLLPVIVMALTTFRLFATRNPERCIAEITPLVFGIIYIPCMLIPQWLLRLEGVEWIFFLYLCVWTSDTTAYYVGKNFGRHKLYPEISPKKTVEGALGSVVGSAVAAAACGFWFLGTVPLPVLLCMGVVIGGISIVGDLVESMFKRDADIKDSGALIPGHGGFLDRFDSMLFAGPALYVLHRVLA